MAAPTGWANEAAIQVYMIDALGTIADVLQWGVSNVVEAVNDLLLQMGYSEAADIPQAKLIESRVLARVVAWRKAYAALAGLHSFSADNQRYDLGQLQELAGKALLQAEQDYLPYNPDYSVSTIAVIHKSDPYIVLPDDTRSIDT